TAEGLIVMLTAPRDARANVKMDKKNQRICLNFIVKNLPITTKVDTQEAGHLPKNDAVVGWKKAKTGSFSAFGRSQLPGQANRGNHRGRVGHALSGDVIGGAVIGRGADERQAERPIHTGLKANKLQWAQALVMIH